MQGLIVSFNPMIAADRTIVLESRRALNRADVLTVSRAQAVLMPLAPRPDVYALAAGLGKPLFPNPAVYLSLDGKIGNQRLFSALGLPHPRSMAYANVQDALAAWRGGMAEIADLGAPLVAKGAGGGMGENVFLVNDPEELADLAQRIDTRCKNGPEGLLLQEFVDCGGTDLRVVLLGDGHKAYWRHGAKGQWRSNISQNGTADFDTRPEDMAAGVGLARRLADAAGLDMAGVDVLVPPDRPPMLLEVNFFFGRSALGGTDAFLQMHLEAARRWLTGRGIDPARISLAND